MKNLNISYDKLMKNTIDTIIDLNIYTDEEEIKKQRYGSYFMLKLMDGFSCIKLINNKNSFIIKPEDIKKDEISYYVDTKINYGRNTDVYGDILTDMKVSMEKSDKNKLNNNIDEIDILGTIIIPGSCCEIDMDNLKELILLNTAYTQPHIRIRFNTPFTENKIILFYYSITNLNGKLRDIFDNNKIFTDKLLYADNCVCRIPENILENK